MALSASASGGGFAGPDGVRGGFIMSMLGLLPPFTLMEATYDGGGLALLAVTFGVVLLWRIQARGMSLPFHRRPR